MSKRTQFIREEATSRDTIDVKRVYVVMCGGNFADAILLSQIIYWNLPDKDGKSKLRVEKDGSVRRARKAGFLFNLFGNIQVHLLCNSI